MKECKKHEQDRIAFLYGELEAEERERFLSHLEGCSRCQRALHEIREMKEKADVLHADIQETMDSIDWESLPSKITEAVWEKVLKTSREGRIARFVRVVFQSKLRPVYAGILVGILIGSLATFLIFQRPFVKERGGDFVVSRDFLERVETEMARRETLDYLDKSQYLLLDFVQYSPGREQLREPGLAFEEARDLLSKKKYINPQLMKFQMAKAKEVCDQIELLFYELTQMSEQLTREDLERIQRLIEENQLLLKIKLLKRELRESEV
jgi:hypothetical protein